MEDKSGTLGGCGLVSAVGDVRIAGERPPQWTHNAVVWETTSVAAIRCSRWAMRIRVPADSVMIDGIA